jgi:RimJ/RimL family protein N-acetyltransferase
MVTLRPPTLAECQLVREWRNDPAVLPMLRTGYKTEAEQAAFYRDVVCNPESEHRYYAIVATYVDEDTLELRDLFVGLGGLTYLGRVQGEAEISLIIDPAKRGLRLGHMSVVALLRHAFSELGLSAVSGECYPAGNRRFWGRMLDYIKPETRVDDDSGMKWRWAKPTPKEVKAKSTKLSGAARRAYVERMVRFNEHIAMRARMRGLDSGMEPTE